MRRRYRCRRAPARGVMVQRTRSQGRASPVRQRFCLPLPGLASRLSAAGHQGQAHPPLPPPDQRQDRALPPHPGRRLGLRPPLHLRDPTPPGPTRMAAPLQSPPTPHRHPRPPTHHPPNQPPRSVQLGVQADPLSVAGDVDRGHATGVGGLSLGVGQLGRLGCPVGDAPGC